MDGGDVVLVDAVSGARRQITRTTGGESNPRWARNDTHVTWVREGNLFIAPVDGSGGSLLTQLTDVAPRRTEPRLSDSQRFVRDEEEKLIDFIEKQKAEKKRREEEQKKNRLPSFELQDRQSRDGSDAVARRHARLRPVAERPVGAKNTIVPNYVTESGYTEDIPGRSNVGDTQDRRLLAVLNLETGKTVWADGSVRAAHRAGGERRQAAARLAGPTASRRARHPLVDAGLVRRWAVRGGVGAIRGQQGAMDRDGGSRDRQDEGAGRAA